MDCLFRQVLDLSGMSALQMIGHMKSTESQKEWQHNQNFMPEVLHKVRIPPPLHWCAFS